MSLPEVCWSAFMKPDTFAEQYGIYACVRLSIVSCSFSLHHQVTHVAIVSEAVPLSSIA